MHNLVDNPISDSRGDIKGPGLHTVMIGMRNHIDLSIARVTDLEL